MSICHENTVSDFYIVKTSWKISRQIQKWTSMTQNEIHSENKSHLERTLNETVTYRIMNMIFRSLWKQVLSERLELNKALGSKISSTKLVQNICNTSYMTHTQFNIIINETYSKYIWHFLHNIQSTQVLPQSTLLVSGPSAQLSTFWSRLTQHTFNTFNTVHSVSLVPLHSKLVLRYTTHKHLLQRSHKKSTQWVTVSPAFKTASVVFRLFLCHDSIGQNLV